MSSGRRGRGAVDRGARGASTTGRGGGFRGGHNGSRANNDSDGSPSPFSSRGQRGDRGFRGATFRGGANARGGERGGKSSFRGRGGHMNSFSNSSNGNSNTTPYAQDDYGSRLKYLRDNRDNEKQRFIDEGRMNPDGPMRLSDAVKIVGICQDMCPEFERVRRIVENDLKAPEFTAKSLEMRDRKAREPDEGRMVKAYQRSAAGMDVELVSDIRPPSVCLKTMRHMIERLDHEEFGFLHGWLWDRTRAVRKDLRTQAVDRPEDLSTYLDCFEQCARLLLLCAHHMSLSTSEEYSHYNDIDQLNQTNMSLKERYIDNRRAGIISPNEAEFQAYRLILCLHTGDDLSEHEINKLPEALLSNQRLRTAILISRAGKAILKRDRRFSIAHQNWQSFWELIESPAVSYMMACAAEVVFNRIRHIVLDTIWRAYRQGSAKQIIQLEDWTLPKLMEVLGLDSGEEVTHFCGLYGFSFKLNANGEAFLDTNSVPWTGQSLRQINEPKAQTFSWRLVESKRHNRLLSAVIRGMSVSEARSKGLIGEPNLNVTVDPEETSLFVPDSSINKANGLATNGTCSFPSESDDTPANLNPFVNPFQPKETPKADNPFGPTSTPSTANANPFGPATAAPNPFAQRSTSTFAPKTNASASPFPSAANGIASNGPNWGKPSNAFTSSTPAAAQSPFSSGTTTSPATGQTVQPGLFDATKHSVKFNSPSGPSGTGSTGIFGTPTNGSPFSSGAASTATKTAAEASAKQSSPFSFKNAGSASEEPNQEKPAFSFAPNGASNLGTRYSNPAEDPTSMFNSTSQTSQVPSAEAKKPFSFSAGTTPSAVNAPDASAAPGNTQWPTVDEQQQKIQEEQQRRQQEEKERREQEEQRRQAQEAEQRRQQEERERLEKVAKAERERAEQLERMKQEREEQERAAAIVQQRERIRKEKEQAMEALTHNVMMDDGEGLLKQFIANQVMNLIEPARKFVAWEKAVAEAQERSKRKTKVLAHRALAHWYNLVLKRKRTREAKERRRWKRENAETLRAALKKEEPIIPVTKPKKVDKIDDKRNGFKKPVAPASSRKIAGRSRAKTVQEMTAPLNGRTTIEARSAQTSSHASQAMDSSQMNGMNGVRPRRPVSTAPTDRTETDWFTLRAMGLDPSKYRKRSHDSDSEDEKDTEADRKRARISTSSTPGLRNSLPPPATDEERIARFRVAVESLSKPVSVSSSKATNQPQPQHRNVTANTSRLITQARELLSANASPKTHAHDVQHDFSRSVPDLSLRDSGSRCSLYGQRTGASVSKGKAAYWGRTSRFVPQHLYGKGPDAILDYIGQSRGSNGSVASEEPLGPLNLSSPIPTQLSYVAQPGYADEEYDEDDEGVSEVGEEGDTEEEGSEEDRGDDDEEMGDSEMEDMEGGEFAQRYEEDFEEEEEEEYSEDDYGIEPQSAQLQQVGGTQDDAIELSD